MEIKLLLNSCSNEMVVLNVSGLLWIAVGKSVLKEEKEVEKSNSLNILPLVENKIALILGTDACLRKIKAQCRHHFNILKSLWS